MLSNSLESAAVVVKKFPDLFGYFRHDGRVKQRVEQTEKKRADNDGDQDLYAGIDIGFGFRSRERAVCLTPYNRFRSFDRGFDFLNLGFNEVLRFLTELFCFLCYFF